MQERFQQRGAVIVMTAFLLPVLIFCTGIAIDLGNAYMHKAVLQNSADAAALGGAHAGYDKGKFYENKAKIKADELVGENQRFPLKKDKNGGKKYSYLSSKKNPDKVHYYVVNLKESVPTYFLRYFGEKYGAIDVEAESIAKLSSPAGENSIFPYMFHFTDDLYVVQTVESNTPNIIKSFDGKIVYSNDRTPLNQYKKDINSHLSNSYTEVRTSNVKHFYRTRGLKDLSHEDENDICDPYFKENELLHVASLDEQIKKQYDDRTRTAKDIGRNFKSKDLDYGREFYCYDSSNLTIDAPIKGNIDEPIYIYVKESDVFHLDITADSRRPIILCQIKDPTNQWSRGGKLHITGANNVTFRGILYVPDCDELNINENNMNFSGSIVSPSIRTQGRGSYKYENLLKNSGGTSGKGDTKSVPEISLSTDTDDLVW